MAMRRELETLKRDHGKLAELLDILRTVPERQAFDVLRSLRLTTADHADLLPSSGGGGGGGSGGSSTEALPRQVLVRLPTQGSIEFRLMVRHAVAYPTLAPLDAAAVGITSLLAASLANSAATELISSMDALHQPAAAPRSQLPFPFPTNALNANPTSPPAYCDPRLALINIGYWSRIKVTNELAATLVSLYLETDHPILGFFDPDLFLQDLVDCRARYCSPLLVSSVLSWACHAYSTSEPGAASMSDAFFDEADALWQHEQASDSLPTVAAAQLLGLSSIYNGNDGGLPYLHLGIQMAQRMALFGLPGFDASSAGHGKEPEHWCRARSHTAWGIFNWIIMRSFMFQEEEPAAKYPPMGEPPGGGVHLRYDELDTDGVASNTPPAYMGQTFPAMCEFWVLTSKWTSVYYTPGGQPVLGRVPFEFAYGIFQKLLAWSDNLHILLARGDQSPHHSVILHIWFHASVLQLFRPFAQDRALSPIKSISTVDGDSANAIFAASLNQLKHLTIVFRHTYSCASYAIFWHVALLCVANAVLQDTQDPQWRPYFMLCVNSYAVLFGAFRVAEGIVRGLLSIAVSQGSMRGAEARALAQSVQARGIHHTDIGRISTSFVVDLKLAITDRDAAQLEILSNNFDDLTLFDEFIAVEPAQLDKSLKLPDAGGGSRIE
ncbi:Nitrogen assimilation transcription factor nirA [Tolypocladium paradoxum]|uniref:Nitrogen assimilation transcription factor nirA n=1 Tax=Tolypocladium paradoxum TaxID=94208 RepID=A0A2S4KS10_9HYPO|nr:Nitrogen assimilation transcription factor nirA [Tolypocladium paradoxum]